MNSKRTFGIILVIIGIVMFFMSNYIAQQVEEGKGQVSSAQKKVDQGNSLFSQNRVTKEIGKGMTGSAQKKIDAGKLEIAKYEGIAGWLHMGGIVVVILGACVFAYSFVGKRKR